MNFVEIVHASPEAEAPVAEHTTATTEEAGVADTGLLASLGINGQLFAFQWINFAVVVLVLWFLVLKPLTKKMSEREKMIDDSIKNAEKIQHTLNKGEKDYQERMDKAKVEANKILEKANVETGAIAEEMKNKTKKDIEGLVEHAKKNIRLEKEEMVAGLKKETAEIIVSAMEKILGEKMDSKKDKELIETALKDLK